MLEILQFYVSSFWIWAGLTTALGLIVQGLVMIVAATRNQRPE
jgi:hypothetical protein